MPNLYLFFEALDLFVQVGIELLTIGQTSQVVFGHFLQL
jgi:hypothetical protein